MPKKPNDVAAQDNAAPTVDPQKQYLMDQFGNLMEQVCLLYTSPSPRD